MKNVALVAALLALSGCVQVDDYSAVVKTPAPADLVGNWQSKGPQSSLVSPEAIGSLIITAEGDTLDCRQWQRVIAVPGKLTLRSGTLYNVTAKREIYDIEREGSTLEYDGMTLEKVDRPTQECADYLAKNPLNGVTP
ncbi:lipoprotein YedD [Siccibacter colletis]|uniref:lipoprotein YedD n=1 Tax=Siccibacter colletis TaxID=1505757 RepID=UPI0028BE06C9|nr:lipoprotein YedD [Siccibacter colletis]WNN50496.1 lipoprotein YedD [Siccibacter colletis]